MTQSGSEAVASAEEEARSFLLSKVVVNDALQEAFNLFLVHREEQDARERREGLLNEWVDLLRRAQERAVAALDPGTASAAQQQLAQQQSAEAALRVLVQVQ